MWISYDLMLYYKAAALIAFFVLIITQQCDQIRRNFAPLVKLQKSWAKILTVNFCTWEHFEPTMAYISFKNGPFPASFSLFSSFQYTVDSKQMFNNILPMTGFEPRTSGIESDRSTN